VKNQEFAERISRVRAKLYKTALTYLGSEALALDAVDEAVYKALYPHCIFALHKISYRT